MALVLMNRSYLPDSQHNLLGDLMPAHRVSAAVDPLLAYVDRVKGQETS